MSGAVVDLAVAAPELLAGLAPGVATSASAYLRVPRVSLPAGPWDASYTAQEAPFGLLVVDGALMRSVEPVDERVAELLGPGDILRPWVTLGDDSIVREAAHHRAIQETEVAVLDAKLARLAQAHPVIALAVMDRLAFRTRCLAVQLAIASRPRVDERLVLLFRYLADRWGTVTPEGVVVPFALTHATLGMLVAAQRPSVSTALGVLSERGVLRRRGDHRWLVDSEHVYGA